jgi:hypothetical protein
MTSGRDENERLQRRLERERRARRQAEIISERGMRELWEVNAELRERVRTRTAALECAIRALQLTEQARSRAVAGLEPGAAPGQHAGSSHDEVSRSDAMPYIRSLLAPADVGPTDLVPFEIDPLDFADRLLDRWQHPAARAGQLLSVEVVEGAVPAVCDWALVQAFADAVLGGCLRHAAPGALSVTLTAGGDGVALSIRDSGPGFAGGELDVVRDRPPRWSVLGPRASHLALVEALADAGSAEWSIDSSEAGTVVSVFVAARG